MIARGLNGQLLSSQSNFQVPFFKKEKENYWTHSVHSLAAAELQLISNYSNTINHVLLRSHTELLSNYQHNHI